MFRISQRSPFGLCTNELGCQIAAWYWPGSVRDGITGCSVSGLYAGPSRLYTEREAVEGALEVDEACGSAKVIV